VTNIVIIPAFSGILGTADRSCAAWVKTTSANNLAMMNWGAGTTGNGWTFLLDGGLRGWK